tara:strand:- start:608 stop:1381 length:774 start_codon:yes stop_codon:yes gene_type:complete
MAVNIDTVYQRVLSLANKEQRGYITPQEFNLFANQAQMEIFEQYFYDLDQLRRTPGNNTGYSDTVNIIEEKISTFEFSAWHGYITNGGANAGLFTWGSSNITLPDEIYRLGTVRVKTAKNGTSWAQVELLTPKEYDLVRYTPLAKPTPERPIMYRDQRGITITQAMDGDTPMYVIPSEFDIQMLYVRRPRKAVWGYVVVNEKSLYNADASTNFEVHPSDETELVYKILKLAGITLNNAEVVQVGQTLETQQIQQEKQ